jgi:hypothetical protein
MLLLLLGAAQLARWPADSAALASGGPLARVVMLLVVGGMAVM